MLVNGGTAQEQKPRKEEEKYWASCGHIFIRRSCSCDIQSLLNEYTPNSPQEKKTTVASSYKDTTTSSRAHSADRNPGSFAPLWFPMIAILHFNEKCHMHKLHFPISTFEDSPTTLDPPTAVASCLAHWSHFMSNANSVSSVVSCVFPCLFFFLHHKITT